MGKLVCVTFLPQDTQGLPVLLKGIADEGLDAIAASTNPIYSYELVAMVATIFQMRAQLTGRRAILSLGNEAACAALAKGSAKDKGVLPLVYALWAIATQDDIGLWAERLPAEVNPAGHPPRDRDLSFETEAAKALVPTKDILSSYDSSSMAPKNIYDFAIIFPARRVSLL